MVEAAQHAERVELEQTERRRLDTTDQPIYELPEMNGGIDLGALYAMARILREQGPSDGVPTVLAALPEGTPVLDIDGLIDDPSVMVIVCCGSGGVGKTTTAASLGLRAAERGGRCAS